MKKILISLSIIGAAGAIAIGATTAFFSDTETSTGNTFTAGALDLTVDNSCYFNKIADGQPNCPGVTGQIITSWAATNLGAEHKFFYFTDVKPGDFGEDTVSLHVDNDAWLRLVIKDVTNDGNGLTGPEDAVDNDADGVGQGEIRQNLKFSVWLDEGATPGFQGKTSDSTEGDNIKQTNEPTLISEGTIDEDTNQDGINEVWDLKDAGIYLIGGQTAYFGIAWNLPITVGNEIQSDSMTATMEFQVQQHRNNPNPQW